MTTFFYRLPRLTVLTILVIVAGGLAAILQLGRQEDPTLTERFGYVLVEFPGADAERIEALVTDPIEVALRELDQIDELKSTSRANVSQVSINIDENISPEEVDNAWNLIRQQVDEAQAQLPAGTGVPEIERVYVGAATTLVSLIWTDETPPERAIMARLANQLADDLQDIAGTEEVSLFGLPSEEVRVEFDTDALSAVGLSVREAADLIRAADARVPAGRLRSGETDLTLRVGGEFETIARIRAVPLIQRADGTSVRVGDIAKVTKGLQDPPRVYNFHNGDTAITVGAFIQTNQRIDLWANDARRVIKEFADNAPDAITVDTVFDQNIYTEARLNGLAKNLGFSAIIVFCVLFFIMGWRAAIVVGSALPLTVCLVLILFNFRGVPLHQMSVTGLVISLGLLIDNAIVVADEYDQLRSKGYRRLEAIDKALKHLFGPLAASTLTTALAFVPIASLPGSAGEFIGTMGLSVIFSIVSSLFVAMTVVPALGGWFDRNRGEHQRRRWWRDGVAIDVISDGYRWTVERVLRFPPWGILVGAAPAIAGFMLAGSLPTQFFPQTERNQFQLDMLLPAESSIEETLDVTQRATEMILAYDGVTDVNWTLGEPAPRVYYNAFNNSRGIAGFAAGWVEVESTEVARTLVTTIQNDMREAFPEAQFLVLPYEQGPPIDAPISVGITGPDLVVLDRLGKQLREVLSNTPGVTYHNSSMQLGNPQITFRADEAATNIAGQRLGALAGDINAEVEGIIAGSILEGVEELPVRVLAGGDRRTSLSDLRNKTIGGGDGQLGTPLSALGDVTLDPQIGIISRLDGRRENRVQAFLSPYALAAPALGEFQARLDASGFELPPGYELILGGEAEARGDAVTNLAALAIPLILIISGAVALVFNSFRMALLVLTTGGLSVGMAFLSVWAFNLPMGFNAIVGALGLLGIAINGSIVVLTQLRSDPASMAGDVVAMREVVVDATRHIVATTLTTMGGFVPLILTADPFWLPLAAGIAGGVAGAALLALYFAPAVFRLMRIKWFSRSSGPAPVAQPAE